MLNKKGGAGTIIIVSTIIIILVIAIYFTFFFSYTCEDIACFRAHQEKCKRTTYINDATDATWFYKILGEENKACEIRVEVLRIKTGDPDRKVLEEKSMNCYLPLGDTSLPEGDIENCHGLLKEELQKSMIDKLNLYIIENIGDISEELKELV